MVLKFVLQFLIGLLVGIYGYLVPNYINLGVFQLGMNKRSREIQKVIIIIALVEIPYCFVCMNSMQWIMQQSLFLIFIKWLIVVLLFVLGIVGFLHAKKKNKAIEQPNDSISNLEINKLLWLAIFNPFQLSAWAIWGTYFIEKTWFEWNYFSIGVFSIGACLGVYLILYIYAKMGSSLMKYFASHQVLINYAIASLLIILGIAQLFRNLI